MRSGARDPGAGRSGAHRVPPLLAAAAALVLLGLAVTSPPPSLAARARPSAAPVPTTDDLYALTRSAAGPLPVVLQAVDAASLQSAVAQANALGCGVDIDVYGTISQTFELRPRCPDPEDLGIRVRGPATILGGIRVACYGSDCAWASLEGLHVEVTDDDAFDVSGDARMAVLEGTALVDGGQANVLTAHDASRLAAFDCSGSSVSSVFAPPVAIIQNARALVAGRGQFSSGTASRDSVLHLGGASGGHVLVALLGQHLHCGAPDQFAVDLEPGPSGLSQLFWGMGIGDCPTDYLLNGTDEGARIEVFGDGQRMALPFPLPAWLLGSAASQVDVLYP